MIKKIENKLEIIILVIITLIVLFVAFKVQSQTSLLKNISELQEKYYQELK